MHHNSPRIDPPRHHAFHVLRDGTWIDVATGRPYEGPYKTDLSQLPGSEWHDVPTPPNPLMEWAETWILRPLAWLAGCFISVALAAALAAWALRSFVPDWLAALTGGA